MAHRYRRLIVGGGRSRKEGDEYPTPKPGDLALDIDPVALPHVIGNIFRPPFKPESFESVIFERFAFTFLMGHRPTGIEISSYLLKPGGTLSILTGSVPLGNLIPDLESFGFRVKTLHQKEGNREWKSQCESAWRPVYYIYISAVKES